MQLITDTRLEHSTTYREILGMLAELKRAELSRDARESLSRIEVETMRLALVVARDQLEEQERW